MSFLDDLFGSGNSQTLRIVITRHGERADFTLGENWFQEMQQNRRQNPAVSPLPRRNNPNEWNNDSPLTTRGERQAASVGQKLLQLGCPIDICYSSPAYRSIQTANKILEAQGRRSVPISIEPGLFECPSWYEGIRLRFISIDNLVQSRLFNINRKYMPYYGDVDSRENESQYYKRSADLMKEIIGVHKKTGGTILLSGHGGSIEALTRALRKRGHRSGGATTLINQSEKVDYCNFAILEYNYSNNKWSVAIPNRSNQLQVVELNERHSIPLFEVYPEQQVGTHEHHHSRRSHSNPQKHRQHHHHHYHHPPHSYKIIPYTHTMHTLQSQHRQYFH